MLRVLLLFSLSLFLLPISQSVAQRLNEKNLKEFIGHMDLVGEIFSDVGGVKTFRLISSSREVAQTDKDLDLIFKAAGINKEKAITALKCLVVTDLIDSGFEPTNAIGMTKKARDNGADISSSATVLVYILKENGINADSTQTTEALRQAKLLSHMKLNPKVAFKENGIDIDLINAAYERRKVETHQWGTGIGEK